MIIRIREAEQDKEVIEVLYEEITQCVSLFDNAIALKNSESFFNDLDLSVQTSRKLHRLSGSAGFIGLLEVHNSTKNCEKMFKENSSLFLNELEKLKIDLSLLLDEIKYALSFTSGD